MKKTILIFLIKKNGHYDRMRLYGLLDRSLISIFVCWLYRKFLITFCRKKITRKKSTIETIGDLMGPIRNSNKGVKHER